MDGHHCAIFPANGANTPVEVFESDTPLIVAARGLIADSGGAGRMRGGLGRRMVIRVPGDELGPQPPVTVAVQAGRFRYPPEGLFGGRPGSKARFERNRQPADPSGLTLCDRGDVLEFHSAGGGGYGNPLERDSEAVEYDAVNGYVSIERAREDYGVVIDPATLKVDIAATQRLREDFGRRNPEGGNRKAERGKRT
jgi:N-methylhydantoinase B